MKKKRLIYTTLMLLIIAGAAASVIWYIKRSKAQALSNANAASDTVSDRTFQVKRDDLPIGLLQGGSVNASKKHKLSLQANFGTSLLWIIEENSWVKAGDTLIELDDEALINKVEEYEINLDNLLKEIEIAREEEKILESTNKADVQSAEDRLSQAEDALEKYIRIERTKTRDSHDTSISNAEAALNTAEEAYEEARNAEYESSKDGLKDAETVKREVLEEKQRNIDTKKTALDNAEANRRAWIRYDHPNRLMVLENSLEQNELNLRKVKISVNSKVVQKKRQINNFKKRIAWTEELLERHRSYLDMMVIKSPVDGVVIYSDPDMRWGRTEVKVGMDVRKGLVLITIPEMSNLIVDFDIPEDYRSKVKVGDKAIISPDSLPGIKFSGEVSEIATLPINLVSWDSSSPKVYKSRIKFDEQSSKLVNGMSVQINIVTKIIPNTLFVPIEAIFEDAERFFVYKNTSDGVVEQDVEIGESNDNFVQITKGLEEEDIVYLYRPYQGKQGE